MGKAANELGLFFCQRHKLTVLGKHPGKVVHAQQILLHGAGICRIADEITGKERLGRGDPFAVYLDLGLILGIKELLYGALRHQALDALAHYVFATVNDLDHIPHEHHPLCCLTCGSRGLGMATPGRLCAKALHIQTLSPVRQARGSAPP